MVPGSKEASPETSPLHLKHLFQSPQTVETYYGQANYIEASPAIPRSDIPVVIFPGWLPHAQQYLGLAEALLKKDRSIIYLHSPGHQPTEPIPGLPEIESRKAWALLEVLKTKDIDQVDAIGHSEAGAYLPIAAALAPERFKNIFLINPVGITGPDSFVCLTARFLTDSLIQAIDRKKNPHQYSYWPTFQQELRKFIDNRQVALKQVAAIASFQTPWLLEQLTGLGIGIYIIHTQNDRVLDINKVPPDLAINGFYSLPGTHQQLLSQPGPFVDKIDEILG